MKNLKSNFVLFLVSLSTAILFFSCSKDEENVQENSITTDKTANKLASPACQISGNTTVGVGTYSYTYTNFGNNSIVNWTITQNGNPVPNTVVNVVTGQGSTTVNINFSTISNGVYRISAYGRGGQDGDCEGILNVTKNNIIDPCACTPVFANEFYNVPVSGGGYVENAIYFGNRTTCTFDWSTVSSVKIQIGGVFGVGSNSLSVPNINTMGQTGGMANTTNWTTTPSGFRNIKIRTHLNSSNVTPGFLRNNTLGRYGGWVTIKRNNGCPDIFLYLNDDSEFSFIN